MLILARFFPFHLDNKRVIGPIAITLTILFIPTIFSPSLNPLITSIIEQYLLTINTKPDIIKLSDSPLSDNSKAGQFKFLNKSFDSIPSLPVKYERIIIFVMESINYESFIKESIADPNSLLNRYKQNISLFNNYYTLNLDSYTSLISMLNSVFVPYQAYVNETNYSFVNTRNNLIRFFNQNGFKSLFLTSYGIQQELFIPDINDWSQRTYMDSIDNNKDFVSVTSNKIEYASEDLAVFADMIDFLKMNKKAFLLQEMVYGHTVAWKQKTGIENMVYYNQYFNKTISELKKNNLLDSTLIVIVSDHGPRNEPYNTESYHIPLLFWSEDSVNIQNNEFLSHIDFKDILLEIISGNEFVPFENDLYTIGNSGELIYGTIKNDGKHIFINNRMRAPRSNATDNEILAFNKEFLDYRNYFEYLKVSTDTIIPAKRKLFNTNIKQFKWSND